MKAIASGNWVTRRAEVGRFARERSWSIGDGRQLRRDERAAAGQFMADREVATTVARDQAMIGWTTLP